MMEVVMFGICLIASGAGSVAGFGGGVMIKPVLDALHILPVSTISFLSSCTVFAMSAVSLLTSKGNGVPLRVRTTLPLAVGATAGGILGKLLFEMVRTGANENMLGLTQSSLLLATTALVWVYTLKRDTLPSYQLEGVSMCVAVGLALGVVSAFLGIGGGPLNVAVLLFFFSMKTKEAAKNSIFIILFSQASGLISSVIQQNVPEFMWHHLLLMAAGGIVGALLGAELSKKMSNKKVDCFLQVLILVIIGINVYNIATFSIIYL